MNFAFANKKFVKILFIIAAVSFSWFGIFGLLHHMNDMQAHNTAMSGCLFNDQSEVCTMNVSEHIALWQGMLTNLPQNRGLLDLLLLAVVLITVSVLFKIPLWKFPERAAPRFRLYIKQHPHLRLFNSLIEKFSQGILNPQIYAPAIM